MQTFRCSTILVVLVALGIGATRSSVTSHATSTVKEQSPIEINVGDRFDLGNGVKGTVTHVWPDHVKVRPDGAQPWDLVTVPLPIGSAPFIWPSEKVDSTSTIRAPSVSPSAATPARIKVGDSLNITRPSVWLYSAPGARRDSEITKADLRSNGDRIIVTNITVRGEQTWYQVRIGCDCLLAPKQPRLGKMPDTVGWFLESDVTLAPRAVSSKPAPKPIRSNLKLTMLKTYRSEAAELMQRCAGQPEHQARIRELERKVSATVYAGRSDWREASEFLMVAMRARSIRCH
jgi:hypothetical protein